MRKCERKTQMVKMVMLAAIILYKLCMELNDTGIKAWDLGHDDTSSNERLRDLVREMFLIR